jgi:pyrimidine deaminase RibD-like protein
MNGEIDNMIHKITSIPKIGGKNHFAFFFRGKRQVFGQNYEIKNAKSTHAEINALHKLNKKTKQLRYIDLLVIRLSKTNKLGESRPCYHCLNKLQHSGLNIRYVYYSTSSENIIREKFNYMIDSEKTYISSGNRM